MGNHTISKVEKLIEREVSLIIQNKVKDDLGFITITGVKCTKDYSYATVYYSLMSNEDKIAATQKKLEHASGFIRTALAKVINRRTTPKLIFKYDDSLDYGNKIDKLLRDINSKKDA